MVRSAPRRGYNLMRMRRSRIHLLPVLLAAVAALAIWSLPSTTGGTNSIEWQPSSEHTESGRPLSLDNATSEPLAGRSRTDEGGPLDSAVDTPPKADEPEIDTADTAINLHVPLYGDLVKRGGAKALFDLLDANNQPLIEHRVRVELWRRVGIRWLEEEAYIDAKQQRVICDGLSAGGLEPGEYDLQIESSLYGSILHTFSVRKNEQVQQTLLFPNWRRIICFEFRTLGGEPVEWIRRAPSVETSLEDAVSIHATDTPAKVLRDPPPRPYGGRGGRGGFAYRRARGDGSRRDYKTATDEGRFYVAVIAGAQNKVTVPFAEQWGTETLEFEGTFLEQEWDRKEVVLDLALDFDEITKDWHQYQTDDPGGRSLLKWIDMLKNPPAPDDPSVVRSRRLVIELDAPSGVSVKYGIQREADEKHEITKTMDSRGKLHWADANPGETVWFELHSMGSGISREESVTFTAEDESSVRRIRRQVPFVSVATPAWNLTPTMDAWAARRKFSLVIEWGTDDWGELRVWNWDFAKSAYDVPATFTNTVSGVNPPHSARAFWYLGGSSRRSIIYGGRYHTDFWAGNWDQESMLMNAESLEMEDLRTQLHAGTLTAPEPFGLVLRAIGRDGAGLPWVEGSILPIEQDERARRLRDIEAKLSAEDARPALGAEFGAAYYTSERDFDAENIDPERMKSFLGEKFIESTADGADLAYYARNGAWYNTHERVKSDNVGYVYEPNAALTDGQVYVLYLWSNSRDDLVPDARIVFKATGDMTDLGAIELPAYLD